MRTEQAHERLSGELKGAARRGDDVLSATMGQGGEPRNRVAAAVDTANVTCQRLEDETVAALKATNRCIHSHPYETIGVFLGLGLIAGVLLSRS
jgi:ElaB/YqjD/DUF883 family membrane-anchored ribosome-binding protein